MAAPGVPRERDDDAPSDEQIVSRYLTLVDRSRKAISILEGLPQHVASCSSIDPFVTKAFESLNELWKLQMSARHILERGYKLKRWEIGEIASKLGQLHYYAYTRRGDTEALRLSFNFYNVIQQRGYLDLPGNLQQRHSSFIIRKMRVLARFAVVCMHLDKLDELEETLRILRPLVDSLVAVSPSGDEAEKYGKLADEGEAMLEVLKRDASLGITSRSAPASAASSARGALVVSHAVLAFNQEGATKFSELPLCLLRFSQSLEFEKGASQQQQQQQQHQNAQHNTPAPTPHHHVQKSLLYRPTPPELLAQTATFLSAMEPSGALVMYINANAGDRGVDLGSAEGLSTMDLYIALQKPLFLVLQGKGMCEWFSSGVLQGRLQGVPFVALVSEDAQLTEYLTNPVGAMLGNREASPEAGAFLESCCESTLCAMRDHALLHPSLAAFAASPLTARYLSRFALCHTAALSAPPLIYPPLPPEILASPTLSTCIEHIQSGVE